MTEILRITLVVILLTIGFASYFLVIGALFIGRVTKTVNIVKQMPGRSLGIGFVNFLFFGAIAIALFAVSEGVENRVISFVLLVPALTIAAVLAVLLSFGLSAMINILGERVFPDLICVAKDFLGDSHPCVWLCDPHCGMVPAFSVCSPHRFRRSNPGILPTRNELTGKYTTPA